MTLTPFCPAIPLNGLACLGCPIAWPPWLPAGYWSLVRTVRILWQLGLWTETLAARWCICAACGSYNPSFCAVHVFYMVDSRVISQSKHVRVRQFFFPARTMHKFTIRQNPLRHHEFSIDRGLCEGEEYNKAINEENTHLKSFFSSTTTSLPTRDLKKE